MAFMLPVIKNDHPLLDPKARRPSFSLQAARKASYTYGESRHRIEMTASPEGRQKSKSVSNDASLMASRFQLSSSRYRSSSSNDQASTSTGQQGKVGRVTFVMETIGNTCSSSSSSNRSSLCASPCERKPQSQKSWSQRLTWIQSKKSISDTR